MSHRALLLLPLLLLTCVGTPVPIPTPADTKALRLSTSDADGRLLLAGLAGAVAFGDQVSIVNRSQGGQRWLAPLAASGSFAVLVTARSGDELELRSRVGEVESLPVRLSVGAGGALAAPLLQVGQSDKSGALTVSGIGPSSGTVLVSALGTGEALAVTTISDGAFSVRLKADAGSDIGAFAIDASGGGAYRVLRVGAQPIGDCLDGDGDGFGRTGSLLELCGVSQTAVADCDDASAEVFPGQTLFFTTAAVTPRGGFDYNCDGKEESELTAIGCNSVVQQCSSVFGWQGSIPACGQSGMLVSCVWDGTQCVEQSQSSQVQACR